MPNWITSVTPGTGTTYTGIWHPAWQYKHWSRALNKALRHSPRLNVNTEGFAFVEDVLFEIGDSSYHLDAEPELDDLMFIIATQDKGRYECSSITGSGERFDLLIRTVQGHSGAIARHINHEEAFGELTSADGVPYLYHYTKSELLLSILGKPNAPGLLPGGRPAKRSGEWAHRADVHCSTKSMGVSMEVPDKFRKRGIDCVIHIDTASLLDAGIRLFVSAAGAVLIPQSIGVEHIARALLITNPKLTLYNKPSPAQLEGASLELPSCQICGQSQNHGAWWCLGCWEPLTIYGGRQPTRLPQEQR